MDCGIATNAAAKAAVQATGLVEPRIANKFVHTAAIDDKAAIHNSGMRAHSIAQDDPLDRHRSAARAQHRLSQRHHQSRCRGETVLDPGCYANMMLNGNVRLQDGEYILNRGNFVVGPTAHVECDACTIFLTSEHAATEPGSIGKVKISSDATVKMSATREGPNAGILFYQDRHAARDLPGDENRVGGSSFSSLKRHSLFPVPNALSGREHEPRTSNARDFSPRLVFAGRVYIAENCDGLDKVTFAATEVRLIS